MLDRNRLVMRGFKCPYCGAYMTAPKRGKGTPKGHVKHMWCWKCKCVKGFVQVG